MEKQDNWYVSLFQMDGRKSTGEKEIQKPKKVEKEETIEEVIEESLEQAMEKEIEDEESLLLDCIDDYKAEFNVKNVNTNSKKFKVFFEAWKKSE